MSSRATITDELLVESGRQGTATRRKIDQKVGGITLELLQQGDGRFRGLSKSQTISVLADTTQYKLDSSFNTAKKTMFEQNTDGTFKNKVSILAKAEVFERKSNDGPTSALMGYIELLTSHADGRGYYLTLSEKPTAATTYNFEYYREPTANDSDVIRKPEIIKHGVRGNLPEYFENSDIQLRIYLQRMEGFRESPERFVTDFIMTPAPRIGQHNKSMHDISQGG